MKNSALFLSVLAASAASAVPVVSNVSVGQAASNAVTIGYELSEAPAIVTIDIQTNVTGDVWASVGVDAIIAGLSDDSQVFRRIDVHGTQTVKWRPHKVWPTAGDAELPAGAVRAIVTAWSTDLPPDYMAVDIGTGAVRYYPSADFVPGGVLANGAYRQTSLLLRRVPAADVTWTMGSIGEAGRSSNEPARLVTLTNDYYMAVFETSQEQWRQVMGVWPAENSESNPGSRSFVNSSVRAMRPAQNISYNEIRTSGSRTTYNAANDYPNPPHASSFLGILNTRTGLSFDLPSEAQWEFACRAGNGENFWGDGAVYNGLGTMPGRCMANGGYVDGKTYPSADCGPELGTAVCGSYAPNAWGIYDMHGNIFELCVDWYQDTVPRTLGAAPNVSPSDSTKCFDGSAGSTKTKRGGAFSHNFWNCRSAMRSAELPATQYYNYGCRVMCPIR